jgi:heme-degrading monooxygenase HmoA
VYIQLINFQLKDMSDAEFRAACDELAPAFASVPGLLTKVWLANPEAGTYGSVYTWRSRDDMQAFQASELFAAVASHPNFAELSSKDFGVIEGPTRVTRGLAAALA